MKVFVSTHETQGLRTNDFCFSGDNELVVFPKFECTHGTIDDTCGCKRAMIGIDSRKGTTTFKAVDSEIDKVDLQLAIYNSLKEGNWPIDFDFVDNLANKTLSMANQYPIGIILERRGDIIAPRKEHPDE